MPLSTGALCLTSSTILPAPKIRSSGSACGKELGRKLVRRECNAFLTAPVAPGSCLCRNRRIRRWPNGPFYERWELRGATEVYQVASAAVHGQIRNPAFAAWWPVLALVCSTLIVVAAAVLALVVFLRPLIKRLEGLASAAEQAVKGFEKASFEFEQASQVMSGELPTTLEAVERASLEFEELGQSLNGLTGGLRKGRHDHKSLTKHSRAAENPLEAVQSSTLSSLEAVQSSTRNSMAKVAKDVAALTAALTPAMDAWRKRISFLTVRFEAASKEQTATETPATATSHEAAPPESKEAGTNWITEWRQQALAGRAPAPLVEPGTSVAAVALAARDAAQVAKESYPSDSEAASSLQAGAALAQEAASMATALDSKPQQLGNMAESSPASSPSPLVTDPAQSSTKKSSVPTREVDEGQEASASDQEVVRSKLQERKAAAEAVFLALSRAEEAASAAAAASGELESALQRAEAEAGEAWWGFEGSQSRNGDESPQTDDGMAFPSSPFLAAREENQPEAGVGSDGVSGDEVRGDSKVEFGRDGGEKVASKGAGSSEANELTKDRQPAMLMGLWGAKSRSGYRN